MCNVLGACGVELPCLLHHWFVTCYVSGRRQRAMGFDLSLVVLVFRKELRKITIASLN